MRFKLDENLPVQLKALLTESGHDAATVADQGLSGKPDLEIATACIAEQRVLITLDLDFADIRAYPPGKHSGIVVFRLPLMARDAILNLCAVLIGRLGESSPKGQLWIVEDSRIRIRA